jgi:DNA mismatch repair protein MutS2
MKASTLHAIEFDRIVELVADQAITSPGRDRLLALAPLTDVQAVIAAQRMTAETARFLGDHPGFPLRGPADLDAILEGLGVEGRPLEPLRLFGLAEYLESVEQSRSAILRVGPAYPLLSALVVAVSSFKGEISDVRRRIDPSGDVADNASPALASIRDRLRRQRQKLRTTLDTFMRGSAKYLQDQVVTDRNGRYVLVVRAEHRGSVPGIVHGGSASGASLYVEPLETVEVNNEIVELEEAETEEVRRILLELTDAFRARPDDLERTLDVATELDVVQARGRYAHRVQGVEPVISTDGTLELLDARHPLLLEKSAREGKWGRESFSEDERRDVSSENDSRPHFPSRPHLVIPVTIRLIPPVRILVIAGPNTGGKTVAIKTAGLLAAMAQAGLHIPAERGSRLPVFRSLFADIGDEQSIANSLSTFSAHITNVVAMDRDLELPALVLLDEVGAGTDPVEGGALGTAVIDHFRQRGAHLIATTHYDALKTYASTTEGVEGAGFGFDPETFAPTYKLIYGSPGRSLAIEIAKRLGMPPRVIAAARENLGEGEKQLADHLARVDDDLRRLEQERKQVTAERMAVAESDRRLRAREEALRDRENHFKKRLDARLDDQLRDARREIDAIIDGLKARASELTEKAGRRLRTGETIRAAGITTGDTGAAKSDARAALDQIAQRLRGDVPASDLPQAEALLPLAPGVRVTVGGLGLEGTIIELHGKHAEIDMKGKRLRAAISDLRAIGGPSSKSQVRVNVDLQPREGTLSELNVIGCTVDEALTRVEKFLDESTVTDITELRIVHGHGTGQLRRAIAEFLKGHPLVARYEAAPQNQGGGGATIVTLRD